MKPKQIKFLIFVASLFAVPMVNALEQDCITRLFTPLVAPLKKSLTTAEERKLIDSWFQDPRMSFEQASSATFDLVFQKRLALLPEELREKILSTLSTRVQKISRKEINGLFNFERVEITTMLPKNLMNTPVEHSTLLHEVEHAIQHHWISKEDAMRILKNDKAGLRFEQEYGAMLAEWHFLSALPESVRKKMADEVMRMNLPQGVIDDIHRSMTNGGIATPDEYVQREWRAGRYSRQIIEMAMKPPAAMKPKEKMIIGFASSASTLLYACAEMKSRKETHSIFFRRVCFPLFLNP